MKDSTAAAGLKARGKELEDSFFARENARLLTKLREEAAKEEKRKEFRAALNVANVQLLDALILQRKQEETWWALVPKNESRLVSLAGELDGLLQPGVTGHQPRHALQFAAVGLGPTVLNPDQKQRFGIASRNGQIFHARTTFSR